MTVRLTGAASLERHWSHLGAREPMLATSGGVKPPSRKGKHPMRIRRDERVEALRRVALFSRSPDRELAVLAKLCVPLSFKPGRVLVREGSSGREWLVVSDGLARATIDGSTTGFVGPGDSVGDAVLLRRGRHEQTLTTETALSAYVFTPLEFWSVLDLCPGVRTALEAAAPERPGHGADRPLLSHA